MRDLYRWLENLTKRLRETATDPIHLIVSNEFWMPPTPWNKNHPMKNVI